MRRQGARSKYGVRTDASGKAARTVDGHLFDSLKEAKRYAELKLLQKAGEIAGLTYQIRYPLVVGEQLVATYVADFLYCEANGAMVIEDVKGVRTPVYRIKKKLLEALYGIRIQEV